MFDIKYKTEDGTPYTIRVDYNYNPKPAILRADPNDSCDDESHLAMWITNIGHCPSCIHKEEIVKDWNCGTLYDIAADKALDDYFGR